MPCDTIQLNSVDLDKLGDLSLLEKALRSLYGEIRVLGPGQFAFQAKGYSVQLRAGQIRSYLSRPALTGLVGEISRTYSAEAIRSMASRFNFSLKQKDATHFVATKR